MLSDTLTAVATRYPNAITAWFFFIVFPIASCSFWTLLNKSKLQRAWHAYAQSIALTLGYLVLVFGVVIVPISAFQIFLAPALLESSPAWRKVLLALFQIPEWFVAQAFWLVPLVWLLWGSIAPRAFIRRQIGSAIS
ncbi:hypothetical protein EON83_30440 [bacterium]|nr:MAG: hypothetical protein EON83_30440 [bacterium]